MFVPSTGIRGSQVEIGRRYFQYWKANVASRSGQVRHPGRTAHGRSHATEGRAALGEPKGSKPAKRRPVLVIQADAYNASKLHTTLVAVITSNTALAAMPGNVFLPAVASGLPKDSVLNVTALVTIDKADLDQPVGTLPSSLMTEIDRGLRRVLGL
jgi:mRNA interferase MazF